MEVKRKKETHVTNLHFVVYKVMVSIIKRKKETHVTNLHFVVYKVMVSIMSNIILPLMSHN